MPTPQLRYREPTWWIAQYTAILHQREPTTRDEFERRTREQEKQQGPDNSVFGGGGAPRNIDVDDAYSVPEEDWETGLS